MLIMNIRIFSLVVALSLGLAAALASAVEVSWPRVESAIKPDKELEQRIEKILAGMTLKEKVGQIIQAEIKNISPKEVTKYNIGSVLSGGGSFPGTKSDDAIAWLGAANAFYNASVKSPNKRSAIPIIWGIDAVHGHNNVKGATIFPHNIGLGATRNPQLIKAVGEVTAREVAVTGIRWSFAPTVAVARDDRWGRTYESYSEDPQLVATMAEAMVVGLQGNPVGGDLFAADKVIATTKHFIGDGGTEGGVDQGNTVLSEQVLRDLHSPGHIAAIAAGAQTVMASFNSWNGNKLHGSHYMLTDVLKGKLGFDGFVIGDWNGHGQIPGCSDESCPQAINAGVDMIMVPEKWREFYKNTLRQVKGGEITEARLDDAVRRILRVKARAGVLDMGKPSEQRFAGRAQILGHPKHRAVARAAVRESLVLLKNDNQILPLSPKQSIFITGSGADNLPMQCGGWSVTWQGDNTTNADFPGATSVYRGFLDAVNGAGGQLELGVDDKFKNTPTVAVVVFGEQPYAEMKGDIKGDVLFADSENNLKIIRSLKSQGIPVVSVFLSGRPLWVNDLIDSSDAFVAAWLPGSEGNGISDLLLKEVDGEARYDFTGKLSFSWPNLPSQSPLNIGDADYEPRYPYGFGLSYSD